MARKEFELGSWSKGIKGQSVDTLGEVVSGRTHVGR